MEGREVERSESSLHGNAKPHKFIRGLEVKQCGKCREWKPLEMFHTNNKNWDKKSATCKQCKAEWARNYRAKNSAKLREASRDWAKANPSRMRALVYKWRKRNPEAVRACIYKCRENNSDKYRATKAAWRKANKDAVNLFAARRRARKQGLPDTLTQVEKSDIVARFSGCALTGSPEYHFDHVIPISTGFGGTTKQNVIPLRPDLNMSKNDRNIFEWFPDVRERFDLSESKFDELIQYLATVNHMSIEEYQGYVYSCFTTTKTSEVS
jgi:hypothetical protein